MSPSISAQDLVAHYCSVEREFTPRGGLVFRSGRFFSPMVVVSGALRIDPLAGDDSTVRLALPGDLIGFEHMIGLPQACTGRVLTDTAPETVSRVISSMRRSGLIARDDTAGSVRIDTLVSQRSANLPGGMARSRISAAT